MDKVKSKSKSKSKSKNGSTPEMEDPLSLMYKNKIAKEAHDVTENAGTKQIFEFDNSVVLNENIPGVNMSFLDRLLHQLTRPRSPEVDNFNDDEEFTEIDEKEITNVTNSNIKPQQQQFNYEDDTKEDISLVDSVRSFIEELHEETDVILGTIDQETLFNRVRRVIVV